MKIFVLISTYEKTIDEVMVFPSLAKAKEGMKAYMDEVYKKDKFTVEYESNTSRFVEYSDYQTGEFMIVEREMEEN